MPQGSRQDKDGFAGGRRRGLAVNRNHSESTVRQIGVVFNVVIRISARCYLYSPAALALNLSRRSGIAGNGRMFLLSPIAHRPFCIWPINILSARLWITGVALIQGALITTLQVQ